MSDEALDETLRGIGVRLEWADMPEFVRHDVEDALGATVIATETQRGGFSPGVAARVTLSDGRRVFLKSVGEVINEDSVRMHRQEALIAAALPPSVPAPRLLSVVDQNGWATLVFESIQGRQPHLPWKQRELELVLTAVHELATSLTPAPIAAGLIANDPFCGFDELRVVLDGGDALTDVDPWVLRNMDRLQEADSRWPTAMAGETLLHSDLRADNMLITDDGVVFVDWPHATRGPAWMDLLAMLPSVALQGGPAPWDIFDSHPVAINAEQNDVVTALAGVAGYFISRGRLPDPTGLPTVRQFQRAQAVETIRWLQQRTQWQ